MERLLTRRFSLENDFMNYNSDDLLYGAMQYLATYHPEMHLLYLTKKNYKKAQNDLANLCGASTKTISRHLSRLIEKGLVKEKKIYLGADKVEYDCYTFPYEHSSRYQIIDNEMLWYVVSTRNHQAVRVYLQLLNWYKWKAETGEFYNFDNKDILAKLGYSTNSNNALASSMVTNILESFYREGIIDYQEYMEQTIDNSGRVVSFPQKRLLFVAEYKQQLKSAPKAAK
jgi:DNA-binding Lrp family transcriptional regulator